MLQALQGPQSLKITLPLEGGCKANFSPLLTGFKQAYAQIASLTSVRWAQLDGFPHVRTTCASELTLAADRAHPLEPDLPEPSFDIRRSWRRGSR